jgi:hypothetical protein
VKSLNKCGIINALGGADDVLLEESESSDSNNSNEDCIIL